MQLYGVVITSQGKRATVKVGQRFANLATAGRSFANLTEGQVVGEFTLAAIHPDHLVLRATGGEQRVYFTRKTDRMASPATQVTAAPVQAPVQEASNSPAADTSAATAAAAAVQTPATLQTQAAQPANAMAPAPANNVAQQPSQGDASSAATPFNLRNSLAAALEAARNNRPGQSATGGTNTQANPFQK